MPCRLHHPEFRKAEQVVVDKIWFIVANFAQEAVVRVHALVVFTSWDKFKTYPYHVFYDTVINPAFLFDERIILYHTVFEDRPRMQT